MGASTINILITSIGRRVELVQAFAQAANRVGCDLKIHGADVLDTAPALAFCDYSVIVPKIKDNTYVPMLVDYCKKNRIDALIPTIDTDLLVLAQNKKIFEANGTTVVISDEDKIAICRDKRLTSAYFESVGLLAPKTVDDYKKYTYGFPAFIKPKDGSSSISAYKVNGIQDLKNFSEIVPDYIIQPCIEGTEYTVDAFCDFNGNPIYITPRIRLAVRSGEVLKTKISQDDKIIEEVKRLISDYKPCGAITIQLISQKNTGKNYYIEINPRYGGGAPLSIKAGADSPSALLRLLMGEKLEYQDKVAEDGAIYCRFDQSVRVK